MFSIHHSFNVADKSLLVIDKILKAEKFIVKGKKKKKRWERDLEEAIQTAETDTMICMRWRKHNADLQL